MIGAAGDLLITLAILLAWGGLSLILVLFVGLLASIAWNRHDRRHGGQMPDEVYRGFRDDGFTPSCPNCDRAETRWEERGQATDSDELARLYALPTIEPERRGR